MLIIVYDLSYQYSLTVLKITYSFSLKYISELGLYSDDLFLFTYTQHETLKIRLN